MKRPTIEGLPSPTAAAASKRDGTTTAPAFELDLMRSLRRRPRLAAGVAAAVFVLIFGFGLTRNPMYSAESLTYIEPLASKVLSDGTSGTYDPSRYDSYLQQQMQTAVRPDILEAAIAKLPPFAWQHPGESTQSAVARLQHSLKVERVSTSYQLSISLVDASPQTAAAVVNAVTNAYLEQGRKDEHAVADQRLRLLGEERQRIQQQLERDRVEQAQLGASLGVANPMGMGNQYDAQVAGVQTQVAGAREAHDLAAAQLASLQGASGTLSPGLEAAADEQIAADSGLNSMKGTINQRKAVLSTQMAGLTPSNPIYKQDQEEIADLDRSLDAMTSQVREKAERRLQDKMRADLQRTADFEGRLRSQLAQQTATATSAAPKLQRAAELTSDIDRLNARYSVVDDSMRGLELESNGPGSAHLSVAAVVPVSPEPSKRKLILLLALPLALISGLLAAVLAHRMDPHVYSGPDVERVLGFLPIGVMPAASEVSHRVMEEYALRLAAGLQSAYRVSAAQSFVFTAASSGIETSGFVRAIDLRLRALGFKALVLDAPAVLRAAPRSESGLRVAAGHRSGEMVRVLEGVRQGYAAQEIDRLKREYDLVLIDAPPLLNSAETEYLVRCADATILVAESGVTLKSELYQSAVLLQQLNVAGVGAVLQELHLKDADPAFQAAIAAVERIQRNRQDGAAARIPPTGRAAAGNTIAEAERKEHSRAEAAAGRVEGALPVRYEQASAIDVVEEIVPTETNASYPVVESVFDAPAVEPVVESGREPVREADPQSKEASGMSPFTWPWQKQIQRAEPEEASAPEAVPEANEVKHSIAGRTPEPVLFFEDRMRARREPERRVEADATASGSEPASLAAEAPPAIFRLSEEHEPEVATGLEPIADAGSQEPAMAPEEWYFAEEVRRETEPAVAQPFAEEELLEPEPVVEQGLAAEPAVVEPADVEPVEEMVIAVEVEQEAVEEGAEAERAEPELRAESTPAEAAAVEAREEVAPSSSEQVAAVNPVAAPEMTADGATAARSASRREPAAPKMEWVTLRFRGTTERVLRIVPSEDDGEGVEHEGDFEEDSRSFAKASAPAAWDEEATEPVAEEVEQASTSHEPPELVEHSVVEQADSFRTRVPLGTHAVEDESAPPAHVETPELGDELAHDERLSSVSEAEPVPEEAVPVVDGWQESQPEYALEGAEGLAEEVCLEQHVPETHLAEGGLSEAHSVEEQGFEEHGWDEHTPSPLETFEQEPQPAMHEIVPEFEPSGAFVASPLMESEEPKAEAEEPPAWPPATTSEEILEAPRAAVGAAEVEAPEAVPELVPEAVSEAPQETPAIPVQASPARLRVPISAWRQDELEPAAAAQPSLPGSAERLSPVLLVSELRSRSGGSMPRSYSEPSPSGSRRSAGAPVEERLTPRAANLTRRWEMLSRFDNAERATEKPGAPKTDELEVAAIGEGSAEADGR